MELYKGGVPFRSSNNVRDSGIGNWYMKWCYRHGIKVFQVSIGSNFLIESYSVGWVKMKT